MSNKKHILTFIADGLTDLFDQAAELYGATGAQGELLAIEMLLLSMLEDAPDATTNYLRVLAEELPKEDFDENRMRAARKPLLDATAAR